MEIDNTKRINPIARIIIIKNGYILLTSATEENDRFSSNLHFLPGGHVEYLESSRDTIVREMREEFECSDQVKVTGFLGALECVWDDNGKPYHEIDLVFKGEIDNIDLDNPPKSKEKHINYNWYRLDSLKSLNLLPSSYVNLIPIWIKNNEFNSDVCLQSEFYKVGL